MSRAKRYHNSSFVIYFDVTLTGTRAKLNNVCISACAGRGRFGSPSRLRREIMLFAGGYVKLWVARVAISFCTEAGIKPLSTAMFFNRISSVVRGTPSGQRSSH